MAISYIGSGFGVNSATLPAGAQSGDLIVMFSFVDGSTTLPSPPSGATSLGTLTGTTCCAAASYIVYNGSTTPSTSGATRTIFHVYRGATINSGTQAAFVAGTTNTASYPALTPTGNMTAGSSWVARFMGHRTADASINPESVSAGTGYVLRADGGDTNADAVGWDSNGAVSGTSVAAQTASLTGTASGWVSATVHIANAAISTITDDFTTLDTTTKWNAFSSVSVSGGQLLAQPLLAYPNITSKSSYDLTGSSAYAQLVSHPGASATASTDAYLNLQLTGDPTHAYSWLVSDNPLLLVAVYRDGGAAVWYNSVAYDPAVHKFLRVRESGGTIFWDTSIDGSSWTNRFSIAKFSFAITSMQVIIGAGESSADRTGVNVVWDNLNQPGASNQTLTPAKYTEAADSFPTATLTGGDDPYWSNVALLAGFDGADGATSYTEESSYARVATFSGGAALSTASAMNGSAALLLDGVDDYVSFPNDPLWRLGGASGTVPWTVEFDWNPATGALTDSLAHHIVGQFDNATANRSWGVSKATNNSFNIALSVDGTATTLLSIGTVSGMTSGTRYRFAIASDGTNIRSYRNGVFMAKIAVPGALFNSTAPFWVGRSGSGQFTPGAVDEVRITSGVARYTTETSYATTTFLRPATTNVTLTPAKYTESADSFPAATVSGGGLSTLTPALYAETADSFYAPAVAASNTLTPANYTEGSDSLYAATASASNTLTPARFIEGADSFYAATVTPGPVTLVPARYIEAGDTFFAAEVAPGPVIVRPARVVDGDSFGEATIPRGAITLDAVWLDDPDSIPAPTALASNSLQATLLADAEAFESLTIMVGQVDLAPPALASGTRFPGTTVTAMSTLGVSLLDDPDTIHAVMTGAANAVQPEWFIDAASFYGGGIEVGGVVMQPALHADGDGFLPPLIGLIQSHSTDRDVIRGRADPRDVIGGHADARDAIGSRSSRDVIGGRSKRPALGGKPRRTRIN